MLLRLLVISLLFSLNGCLPKERFWWSPNGKQAAVIIDQELHLTDISGDLIAKLQSGDSEPGLISSEQVTWLPDNSGIIVTQIRAVSSWKKARPLLRESEVTRIETLAQNMAKLLTAQATLQPNSNSIQAILLGMLPDEEEMINHALLLAYQQEPEAIVRALKKALPKVKNLNEQIHDKVYNIHELALLIFNEEGLVSEKKILARDIRLIGNCRISPTYPVIAFARRDGSGLSAAIETYSLDTGKRTEVTSRALSAFDWTPDGRSLIYMTPLSGSESTFKRIRKMVLLTKTGEPMVKSNSDKVIDLATATIPFLPRLEVLTDGRILFAAQAGAQPARGAQPDVTSNLFLLSKDGSKISRIPTAAGDLPMNLSHFVSSPDGKSIAVVESDTDALVVVDTESGRIEVISKPHRNWKCRTLPNWRSNTELAFASLNQSGQIDWVLRDSKGDLRILSNTWPTVAMSSWMEFKPPTGKK